MAGNYFSILCIYMKMTLKSEGSFQKAFYSKIIIMILNNFVLVLMWILFMERVKNIAGWELSDMVLLYGVTGMVIGIADLFFFNARNVSELISNGGLDFYLYTPISPFFHMIIKNHSLSALGDIVFAIIMFVVAQFMLDTECYSVMQMIKQLLIFFTGSTLGAIVFVSFAVFLGSMAFFVGKVDGFVNSGIFSVILFSTYPGSIYSGIFRILTYSLIPAGFVAFIPVSLVRSFSLQKFLIELLVAMGFFLIAFLAFNLGLKRYISSSMQITGE